METYMRKTRKGVTLVELVMYVAILGMIIFAISAFTGEFARLYTANRAYRDLATNGQAVFDTLAFQLFHGEQVYDATSLFDNAQGQLSIRTEMNPAQDESVAYVDYWLGNDRVWEKTEGGSPRALTNDRVRVTTLFFRKFLSGPAEGVEVEATLEAPPRFSSVKPAMTFTRFLLLRQR